MKEIEHKFLVITDDYRRSALKKTPIEQGFLNTDPDRTVRVRLRGSKGYLTVKGRSNDSGTSRFEWEHPISKNEAKALLSLCEPGAIKKTRFEVEYEGKLFEIDVFHEDNEGLVIAEIELEAEGEHFEKPEWLGREVTGVKRYYNSMLSKHPYSNWSEEERNGE
ncbi:CYTH domain-containing protein [Robertkochia flava]|uniref:CYTH domain-containing protein n=1 Tax=Robertkochia flava TaxID=3447986 RepID=UPI001CCC25A3|nr:CYTH domain-containing protein [Robertkochia marina]